MTKKLFTVLLTLFISLTTIAETTQKEFEYIKSYVPAKITNVSGALKDTVIIKTNDEVITKLITYKIRNNELHIVSKVPMSSDCITNLINNDIKVIVRSKTPKTFITAPNTVIVTETYNNSGNF
jgi:hypothetical protein